MEIFWLVTFVATAILAIYISKKQTEIDYLLVAMPFIALLMYLIRRFVRKKQSK